MYQQQALAFLLFYLAQLKYWRFPSIFVPHQSCVPQLRTPHAQSSFFLSGTCLSLLLDAPRCRHRALRSDERTFKLERGVLWQQARPPPPRALRRSVRSCAAVLHTQRLSLLAWVSSGGRPEAELRNI